MRNAAAPAQTWSIRPVSRALPAAGAALTLLFAPVPAEAQNSSAVAGLQSQIQRYGCHLPQYAASVAGCRDLHARMRALQSGTRASGASQPSPRYSNGYPGGYPSRPPAPRPSSGGGFFSSLFGGSGQPQQADRNRYQSYGGGSTGASYGYSNYSGSYRGYGAYGGYGRYRTLCVRTCDGYYWPVSFATTRGGFARDARQCESSCSAPAQLFVHRNPGADVEHMVDLQGRPYSSMENAFRYREEYVENCRCKPEPWSEAAREEYERRAEAAENPDTVNTPANDNTAGPNAGGVPAGPAGWSGADYAQPQPRPEPARRPRYRANDPSFEGRWWAGSW
jgi:hypothetical protein